MDFLTFLAISLSITNAGLGLLVFLKNENRALSKMFLLFTLSSVVWVGGLALVQEGLAQFSTVDIPTIGLRIAFGGAVFVGLFFLLFTITFPEEKKVLHKYVKQSLSYAGYILALISVLTGGIVKEVYGHLTFGYEVEYGPVYPLYVIYIFIVFGLAFKILINRYKTAQNIEKTQLKYFLIGAVLSIVPVIITNLLVPTVTGMSSLSRIGPLFISVLVVSVAYAITKHSLFDIRIIATEIFTAIFIFIFLANLFFSDTTQDFIINGVLLIFAIISGILLIRGTIREIEALEELSDKKSEFLSIASHQLRTPISSMKGYLAMLREGDFGKLNKEQLLTVNKTYKINEGMLRLINDFLNLSRAEKGTLDYAFQKINLADMVDGIVEHLRVWADVKNVDINWEKPEEIIEVYADEGKLSQVISNLIDNAIKYTQTKGGVSVKIAKEGPHSDHVRVYVKDSGIGIDKDELESIFQSFERGNRGKKENAGGSGLGLYVAKMIVEGHNGRIWAESEGEGKGSTFVVELPLTPLENITQKRNAEDIYK